jgi:hypothetical protein
MCLLAHAARFKEMKERKNYTMGLRISRMINKNDKPANVMLTAQSRHDKPANVLLTAQSRSLLKADHCTKPITVSI